MPNPLLPRHRLWPLPLAVALCVCPLAHSAPQPVFKDKSGRVLTQKDLAGATGQVNWETSSGKAVPAAARELHEQGRQAGQQGQTDAALDYFARAAKAAPDWPYPVYDAAFTFLLQRQYAKAFDLYRRADQLAPRGFFTAKTALHSLRQERERKIPEGTYFAYVSMEWMEPEKQSRLVRVMVDRAPQFAPAWKARALLEDDPARRLRFLERGLASDPDRETKGFLLLHKATALQDMGKGAEAKAILGTLALDPASPLDIEVLAKFALAQGQAQGKR